jgi:precorrin-6Y C5,15-methyltransferase (decarboxylating)
MKPWLAIVGIGEDGPAGLSPAARTLIDTAEVLIGAERHLARLPTRPDEEPSQERLMWSSTLAEMTEQVVGMRGRRVTVLATGDPMLFGIGATLAGRFSTDEVTVVPSLSAFTLSASRLHWPLHRVTTLSVHGRPVELVAPHITPDARLLILTQNAGTPARIAGMLTERGFGDSRMVALSHLGGSRETSIEARAREWGGRVADFHTLAVECVAGPDAMWHPRIGLADDAFRHDGKLTKREVRTAALAKLMPHPDALLIDVGAGCGSVCIEWMRAEPNARAIAIEPVAERRAMAAQNAASLGVPHLDLRDGNAPEALPGLPAPDAIFIGGGISDATIAAAAGKLRGGGRLVAHAVTLESEAVLTDAYQHFGGDLVRLAVQRAEPIGSFSAWRPAMPVTQWAWRKA